MAGSQVASSCLLLGSYDRHAVLMTVCKVGAGAIIAFAMELSEYLVVVNTSSLTLSIAGVFKVTMKFLSSLLAFSFIHNVFFTIEILCFKIILIVLPGGANCCLGC